jgi:transposase
LKFIPPDWPNLNIIERGWKILKKKVVDNKFYLKLDDVRKNVLGFLENQSGPEEEFQHIW